MSAYSNALSDRLVLCEFFDCIIYTVYAKDESRKWTYMSQRGVFPEELGSSIFSVSHRVCIGANFCLAPLSENVSHEHIYKLNFGAAKKLRSKAADKFKIIYDDINSGATEHLVGVQDSIDIELLCHKLNLSTDAERILIVYDDVYITILVKNQGELVLANRYKIANIEESFYYVMLAIDQLNLTHETLKIDFVGGNSSYTEFRSLIRNYVHTVNNIGSLYAYGLSNKEVIAQYFSECVL